MALGVNGSFLLGHSFAEELLVLALLDMYVVDILR